MSSQGGGGGGEGGGGEGGGGEGLEVPPGADDPTELVTVPPGGAVSDSPELVVTPCTSNREYMQQGLISSGRQAAKRIAGDPQPQLPCRHTEGLRVGGGEARAYISSGLSACRHAAPRARS